MFIPTSKSHKSIRSFQRRRKSLTYKFKRHKRFADIKMLYLATDALLSETVDERNYAQDQLRRIIEVVRATNPEHVVLNKSVIYEKDPGHIFRCIQRQPNVDYTESVIQNLVRFSECYVDLTELEAVLTHEAHQQVKAIWLRHGNQKTSYYITDTAMQAAANSIVLRDMVVNAVMQLIKSKPIQEL